MKFFLFAGYILGYALALYMGHPTKANIIRFGCSGVSTFGMGSLEIFLSRHMGDILVYKLSIISVSELYKTL